jgi:pyridoxal phosphate enzyme (YggS family)
MSSSANDLRHTVARVREQMARAAERSGRRVEEITLVAVSKTHPANRIQELFDAGVRHFGENRVQEWESKAAQIAKLDAVWHMIGHVQKNKAARAAALFHSVDSLDSIALALRLDRAREEFAAPAEPGNSLRILVEVKLDPQPAKFGLHDQEVSSVVEAVLKMPHLELRGLMGVPPYFDNPEDARPYFQRLHQLREALRTRFGPRILPVLSMGMSHDFEVAIEEGATEVRVGTALFGQREKAQP